MGWLLLGLLGLVVTTGDDGPSGGAAATPDGDGGTIALSCDDAIDVLPEAMRAPFAEAIAHGTDPVAIQALANELHQAADYEDQTTSAGRYMRAAMLVVAHCLEVRAASQSTYQPQTGGALSSSLAGPAVYKAPGARSVGYSESQV